jgi:hypothetical protein
MIFALGILTGFIAFPVLIFVCWAFSSPMDPRRDYR